MTYHPDPVPDPGTATIRLVIAGVDTHSATHNAAVLDGLGGELGDQQFPATVACYVALLGWVRDHGQVVTIGVEGTGSYGAGLTRHLQAAGASVVEIDRPDRRGRRARGKFDPIDAYAAARAALSGAHVVVPKARDGIVEAIRMLRITRRSAVKARTQSTNQLKSLLVTAPPGLRERLRAEDGGHDEDLRPTALSRPRIYGRPGRGDRRGAASSGPAL
jgi:transposase